MNKWNMRLLCAALMILLMIPGTASAVPGAPVDTAGGRTAESVSAADETTAAGAETKTETKNSRKKSGKTKKSKKKKSKKKVTMTIDFSDDYSRKTLARAQKVVNKVTKSSMSKSQKLKKCFRWVEKKPYVKRRKFKKKANFVVVFANDDFQRGGGNCISDACAFALLAKTIGCREVYVCMDGKTDQAHGWTEIEGKAYDPLFATNRGFKKHYAASYKVFRHPVVMRFKIS